VANDQGEVNDQGENEGEGENEAGWRRDEAEGIILGLLPSSRVVSCRVVAAPRPLNLSESWCATAPRHFEGWG
jgi:hypothetical protein